MITPLDLWLLAAWMHSQFQRIDRRLDDLMAMVQIEQSELDSLATTLGEIGTALADEIESLKLTLPDADLSGVEAQVAALQALEVPSTP